ncbi:hypothetical protein [Streptococcus suis]|uniref:hypothetical protein n=2 Tax=Streptococcus suis TaxID=1307 RepID=UPI000CF5A2AE|nr:hypothetical protein [Streptococcus suis]
MVNWKQMFNRKERQDASQDDWAEYTESSLQEFMKSDFMQDFADKCSNALKEAGREDFDDYSAIKLKMSLVLEEFGYPPLNAMEDAYSEKRQLEMLQEFKDKYLNSR